MNKKRKQTIVDSLADIKALHTEMETTLKDWNNRIGPVRGAIEDAKYDEEAAHDNLPEVFQWDERGEKMQEIVDLLDPAVDCLNDAATHIGEALEKC